MKKTDTIHAILKERSTSIPKNSIGQAYAPSNIALCKYWGKRDQELNLPNTSSLSIGLGTKGANTEITIISDAQDRAILNGQLLDLSGAFGKRLTQFLNLFRCDDFHFHLNIETNIPIGAGLASSACGFAALVQALDQVFGWNLTKSELSILARLGSGSASRSLWQGFVEWHAGTTSNGLDSFAEPLFTQWPEFCVGLMILNSNEKPISSREAMQRTIETSHLYTAWPAAVDADLVAIKQAITNKDFHLLGKSAENNAMTMHATMQSAWPPIVYSLPETHLAMQKIWQLRAEGLPLYFTQDAGPNLKLLFLESDIAAVQTHFPSLEIIPVFRS